MCVGYDGVGMLTAAAALATGLSTAIDGLRVVGGDVCAGGISFGGTALRVFFGVLLLQDIFWLGFSKDIVWSDEESLT